MQFLYLKPLYTQCVSHLVLSFKNTGNQKLASRCWMFYLCLKAEPGIPDCASQKLQVSQL